MAAIGYVGALFALDLICLPARLLRSDSRLFIHYLQIDRLGYATFRVSRNIGLIRFGQDATCWPTSGAKVELNASLDISHWQAPSLSVV